MHTEDTIQIAIEDGHRDSSLDPYYYKTFSCPGCKAEIVATCYSAIKYCTNCGKPITFYSKHAMGKLLSKD